MSFDQTKPERKTEPGSLLSQWWTVLRVLYDRRTKPRHAAVAMVVVEAFRRDFGNGRASISYIKRATRMDDKTIIKTCRELADWGFVLRHVANGRVTEYVPAWATTKPYPASTSGEFTSSENTSGDFTGGTSGDFTGGVAETSPVFSRESYLPSPAYSPADGIGTKVSASGPGAVPAPAVAGINYERVWRAYRKYGNKQSARKVFDAIENPDVDFMAQRAAAWAASAKPGQRRMPLEKWLAAEKYDEADRQVQPKARVCKPEGREPSDADYAIESARAARSIERKAIDVGVPLNVPVTVVSDAVESAGGDKWLRLLTDKGSVGILLEANSCERQQAGQMHFAQLTDACELTDVSDGAAFRGMSFMVTHDGIVSTQAGLH